MKILIVIDFFSKDKGGAIKIAYEQADALKNRGHDVFVFTGTFDNNQLGWQKIDEINVFKVKIKNLRYIFRSYICLFNFKIQKQFKNFLKETKPEIIHFHNLYYYFPFSLFKIAKKSKVKVFFTAHDVMTFSQSKLNYFITEKYNLKNINEINYKLPIIAQIKRSKKAYNPFRNLFIRYYLKFADKIFAVSHSLQQALSQNKIKNVEVIHNGIDVDEWKIRNNKVENFKIKYGLNNKKIVFFGGRLSAFKGGGEIIEAMKIVVQQIPNTVLLIAGEKNKYAEYMLKFAQEKKVSIVFTGWLKKDELKAVYCVNNLLITPSIYLDPFPTVNLEAMATGKPVIGTCFGGTSELVVNNETGYIVNPLNTKMLAEKIIDLLDNPEKAEKFGQAGYQRIKEKFSLNKQIQTILGWYNKFI